jgi:hypothetical protein
MHQRHSPVTRLIFTGLVSTISVAVLAAANSGSPAAAQPPLTSATRNAAAVETAEAHVGSRWQADLAAINTYRPGYAFWQHVFTIPDGAIAYGSAVDGRLLVTFPAKGDWLREARWYDPTLAPVLAGRSLPRELDKRRDEVAQLLESVAGPVVHNPTRGTAVTPNARRYGAFLQEWGTIYQRFGVPAEIGLAQALVESGFNGTRRSEAGAVGFCQWLRRNWMVLGRLSPHPIEAGNQTTQAAYCAAYLTFLSTKHGSWIPALSEHHSGGTNVARTMINGERLGGADARDRYFLGAQLARDLRLMSSGTFSDLYRTYGPRSYRYAEMTFGNTFTVASLTAGTRQVSIHAMRTPRAIAMTEITRRTRLSADEVRRFNPALVSRVPAGATIYLPMFVKEFGRDVAFWHRPSPRTFEAVLNDFVRLDGRADEWHSPAFAPVLREFEARFRATRTEEGHVMATVIAYSTQEMYNSGRPGILHEFRSSDQIRALFERAIRERDAQRSATAGGPAR